MPGSAPGLLPSIAMQPASALPVLAILSSTCCRVMASRRRPPRPNLSVVPAEGPARVPVRTRTSARIPRTGALARGPCKDPQAGTRPRVRRAAAHRLRRARDARRAEAGRVARGGAARGGRPDVPASRLHPVRVPARHHQGAAPRRVRRPGAGAVPEVGGTGDRPGTAGAGGMSAGYDPALFADAASEALSLPCFYLTTHRPNWLWDSRAGCPLMISYRTLRTVARPRPMTAPAWALDSGGFMELAQYGRWIKGWREVVAVPAAGARDLYLEHGLGQTVEPAVVPALHRNRRVCRPPARRGSRPARALGPAVPHVAAQ